MPTDYANSTAIEHLIQLSKTAPTKGNEYHKTIIHGIGEAGGAAAVEHLVQLSQTAPTKGNEYHKTIISALGRAGRIS